MTRTQKQLVVALLEAHLTNLRGSEVALGEIPELALIANEGWANLDEQIALTEGALASLNGTAVRA